MTTPTTEYLTGTINAIFTSLLLLPVPYSFAACVLGFQQGLFDISRRKHSKPENELYCTLKMSKLKVVCYGVGLGGLSSKLRPLCYAPMLPTTSFYALGWVLLFGTILFH